MGYKHDLTGEKFGKLTVISFHSNTKTRHAKWLCQCVCGNRIVTRAAYLRNGGTSSCGCIGRQKVLARMTKHGKYGTNTYRSWSAMKRRCLISEDKDFKYYGARGIVIDQDWMNFKNFYRDMGDRPINTTLDRINNNENYTKSNCRWATLSEQNLNRRKKIE